MLSAAQRCALEYVKESGGIIHRRPGGFWGDAGYGTSTIEALVKRELLVYSEWKVGRNGKFPVEARIVTEGNRA